MVLVYVVIIYEAMSKVLHCPVRCKHVKICLSFHKARHFHYIIQNFASYLLNSVVMYEAVSEFVVFFRVSKG